MLRKCVALLALCVLLFSAGCRFPDFGNLVEPNPDDGEIEAGAVTLDAQEATELRVWYGEHDNVWDARVHSMDTCPFLAWTPNATRWRTGLMPADDWGEFLHDFFRHKHKEEKHCDCDEMLGVAKPAPAPPAAKPDKDDDDDDDDDRDEALKELLKEWLKERAPDLPEIRPK